MKANCHAIFCPKHPKWGMNPPRIHGDSMFLTELKADVDCFEPGFGQLEDYETLADMKELEVPTIVYGDGETSVEELSPTFWISCRNEEYKEP